ncbi:S-layer homology domain-containing protein [Dysosmobacter sp.]|jgi:uncharacterized repeat protein (TIGR02543 family)|uniref:S-layer homology domain-containing protein n=1 Tax=Dysosmobacter sp. TaxID=2591382 RepID=UPI003D8FD8FD
MRKRIGSLLLALVLAANLSAWATADSITQLDPAPTTPTDDPFPTVQSSIAFMYHGVRRSHVGDATTGATAGDGARFAWDANQNGRVGTITLNADGTWSYRMDNDSSTLKTLQPGETITERFTYGYTDGNDRTANGSVTIYVLGTGRKDSEPRTGVIYPVVDSYLSSDSTGPVTGNVLDYLRDEYGFSQIDPNDPNFAWDDNQEAVFGTISLESNGDFSYVVNNDHPYVKSLPYANGLVYGQSLTEEFEFKFTRTEDTITEEPSNVGDVISGWLVVTIGPGGGSTDDWTQPGAADHTDHNGWTELTSTSDILIGSSYYLNDDVTYTGTAPIRVFGDITLCLNGHALDLNGKQIYLCSGASLTLCDCTAEEGESGGSITGGSVTNGAVYVDNGGTFDMTGGQISGSGGVYVKGTFNMTGGSITDSTADHGGGVYVNGGDFTMAGGTISDNTADCGGGVCVTGSGSFNMAGGTISHNTADYGGGVCVNSGSFHMSDTASITDNTADYGGGVYIPNTGSFIMESGEITGNTADANGGGVYVNGGGFTMESGTITGNTADYGGGVFAAGDFALEAGEIAGNTADYGGGVYLYDGTFTLTGGSLSSIYLYDDKAITIGGALNDTQKIGVTMRTPGVFTSGWSTAMGERNPADSFTPENAGYTMALDGGEATLVPLRQYTVTFYPNGGSGTMEPQSFFENESKALTANAFVRTDYTFTGWNTQPDGSGTSYADGAKLTLTNDLTLYAQWNATPSSDSTPTYSVILPDGVTGGTVTAAKRYAEEDETFRFTVTPDEGYVLGALTVTDSNGNALALTDEGSGKYSFKMPARRVSIEVSFRSTGSALPFADVGENYWAYGEITWAYENGYMSGTSATAFNPGGTVSRQQVWMILARMAGENPANMAEAKAWAAANGISDGTNPGGAVTRQQLAALLYRYAVLSGYDVSVGESTNILSYTDASAVSEYAIPAMQWACGVGILNGTGDGSTLSPQGSATRAQLAVMLYRWLA